MGKKRSDKKPFVVEKATRDAFGRPLVGQEAAAASASPNTVKRPVAKVTPDEDVSATASASASEETFRIHFRRKALNATKNAPPSENPQFSLEEITGDLFDAPPDHSLAHCIAEDLHMSSGIATEFRRRFKGTGELADQSKKTGDAAILERDGRYIYYLVTKKLSRGKPTVDSLKSSLRQMREHAVRHSVKNISMPAIGCGLDRLDWLQVKNTIMDVFKQTDVHIVVYNYNKGPNDAEAPQIPSAYVTLTSDPLLTIPENNTTYAYLASPNNKLITREMMNLDKKYRFLADFRMRDKKITEYVEIRNTLGLICVDDEGFLSYEALEKSIKKYNVKLPKDKTCYLGLEVDYDDELPLKKLEYILKYAASRCNIWICHPNLVLPGKTD